MGEASVPIACSLDTEAALDRVARWRALGERALLASSRLDSGMVQVRYTNSADTSRQLTALAALEADCCAFLTLVVDATGLEAILTIQPSPGAATQVEADLEMLASLITGQPH